MAVSWGLEGRAADLDRAVALLDGDGAGILLLGPAGVGKSRLAAELGAHRARSGHQVEHLAGSPAAAGLPLGAVAPLLPADVVDVGLPVLVVLRRALAARAEGRPVTFVVDDAHLLDDASALLVQQLASAGDIEVVATQRSGTLAPDPVTRLWRDQVVHRVEIGPLDREATAALAAAIAGDPLDDRSLDELWRLSRGNPLYVREVLLAALDHPPAGDGPLLTPDAVAGASRLTDLVRMRLGDLDDAGRDALLHIAFGEPLGPGELDHLVPAAVLDDLDARGLLESSVDRRRLSVRLVHPLYGEVLRAGVSPLQGRRVRYRLAEALQATGARRREDAVRLAAWAVDGGLDIDPAVLRAAARTARFSLDLDLAERLARRALDVEPDFATAQILFDVLYEQGDPQVMEAHIERWAPLAADDGERTAVAMARAITAFWRRGDAPGAWAALDLADDLAAPSWAEEARGLRATLLAFAGEPGPALDLVRPLLDRGPDRVLIHIALAASQALRSAGRPAEGVGIVRSALDAYAALGEQALLISVKVLGTALVGNLTDSGRIEEAEEAVRAGVARARETGDTSNLALASLSEGWLMLLRGRAGAAAEVFTGAAHGFAISSHWGMERWGWMNAALAHAVAGDAAAAREALARVDALGAHPALVFESTHHRARAWLAWLDGHPVDARDHLAAGAEASRARGDVLGELLCLHDLARLGRPEDALGPFEERLAGTDGALYPLLGAHVRALVDGSAEALGAVAEGFAEVGTWLWASEAAVAAGEAARRHGDPRAATAWARRADTWRARCDTVRTPGLVPTAGPVPLTRREREVAILAAQGLSSRDVGERLFVGHRTVESHLARIYTKLGIRSRAELSRLLDGGTEAIVE